MKKLLTTLYAIYILAFGAKGENKQNDSDCDSSCGGCCGGCGCH